MLRRRRVLKWILLSALLLIIITALTMRLRLQERSRGGSQLSNEESALKVSGKNVNQNEVKDRLCLLIPFRDRMDELKQFAPHMNAFLSRQGINFTIVAINQADALRFNRGSLLNAGFLYVEEHRLCNYVALHDVDLLPLNQRISYEFPQNGPRHLSPPGLHPKYDYSTFLGGILLLQSDHFRLLDGFSNRHWGWGLEDDEFRARINDAQLVISRPEGVNTGPRDTFQHLHSPKKRARDYRKCYNQRDVTRRRDRETGLHTLDFELSGVEEMLMPETKSKVTMLHVHLNCDTTKTPWCDCSNAPAEEMPLEPMDAKDNIMPRLKKKKKSKGRG